MSCWQIVLTAITAGAAIVAAIAGVFAAVYIGRSWKETKKTWQTSKETQSYQIMLEFMREYSTPEMGNAVEELHHFFREISNSNFSLMIHAYNSMLSMRGGKESLPKDRRKISTFLQRLGVMHHNKVLSAELISGFWHKDDLETIIEIVIALDTRKVKPADPLPPAFQNLRDLLNDLRRVPQGKTTPLPGGNEETPTPAAE